MDKQRHLKVDESLTANLALHILHQNISQSKNFKPKMVQGLWLAHTCIRSVEHTLVMMCSVPAKEVHR